MANEALSALAPASAPITGMGARFPAQEAPSPANSTAKQTRQAIENSNASATGGVNVAGQAPQTTGDRQSPSLKDLEKAVKKLNDSLGISPRNLAFSIDKDTKKVVVKVIDSDTKEVIKQIPPDEILAITKALDKLQGMLVEEKA